MIHQIKLIREIKSEEGDTPIPGLSNQKLEITLDGEISWPELLEQFDQFIKAMSYVPPANSHLEYVSDDADDGCCGGCGCDHDEP